MCVSASQSVGVGGVVKHTNRIQHRSISTHTTHAPPRPFLPLLPSPPAACAISSSGPACSTAMAFWKLSSRKRDFSSTTRYSPSPPEGKM